MNFTNKNGIAGFIFLHKNDLYATQGATVYAIFLCIIRRLFIFIPFTLVAISLTFFALSAHQANALSLILLETNYSPEQIQVLLENYHLHLSPLQQYLFWLKNFLWSHGSIISQVYHQPVFHLIQLYLPASLQMAAVLLISQWLWWLCAATCLSLYPQSWLKVFLQHSAIIMSALPSFILVIIILHLSLGWPWLEHVWIQLTILGLMTGLKDHYIILQKILDYPQGTHILTTMLAQGWSYSRLAWHNILAHWTSLLPWFINDLPHILMGSLVISLLLNQPSLATLLSIALQNQDWPLIMAMIWTWAMIGQFIYLSADILTIAIHQKQRKPI